MGKKSILLAVSDPQVLADVTHALGAEWEANSGADEQEILAQLEKRPSDALLVDFNFASPDASELLNQVLEKYPQTERFLFAYEADLALVAAKVQGSPQILPKPLDFASLKSRLESGETDADSDHTTQSSETSSDAPVVPSVYAEVLKALDSPGVTSQQLGEILGRDAALQAELVKLTSSTHLGLHRDSSDPAEAVEALGFDAVRAVVLALQFLAEHSRLKRGYLSLDQIWQHSVNVAQIARDLVLFETKDRALADQALMAGLLHDLGKVVLAANFDDLYGRVHSLARKQPVTLWDIEKEMFGANHGEIGACLLGMWNLPAPVVEAAALHHEPPLGEQQQLTPLAAVHIADVLDHELRPADAGMMAKPVINSPFLNELGLLQRLPIWRATFANCRSAQLEFDNQTGDAEQAEATVRSNAPASRTGNYLPGPVSATRTATSGQPNEDSAVHSATYRRGWFYAGSAAVVLLLLALWFRTQPELTDSAPIYARTPSPSPATAVAAPVSGPDTNSTAGAQPDLVVSEEAPPSSTPAAAVPEAPASQPIPEPTIAAAPAVAVTNVSQPVVAAAPMFRLNAIIYSPAHPSAIVNGQTVSIGDSVDGAKVVGIGRTTVSLQFNSQRKTLQLR